MPRLVTHGDLLHLPYLVMEHIEMGAATQGLQFQRLIATVPIQVAMDAPCTVMLVTAKRPFELLVLTEGVSD